MKKIKKYIKVWWMMSVNSFSILLAKKSALFIFLFAKVIRFSFFFLFIFFLLKGTGSLAGYTTDQVIFFFLTFNLIDVISQFLFRQVYSFRPMIVNGDFDLVLVKPINALFRVLMGGADIIDLITIPPLVILTVVYGIRLHPNFIAVILFFTLFINAFLIAAAFYIAILALAIVTSEIDHAVMIYRDLTNLGKLPVDIYKQPLKWVITYLIPVGIMMTFPGKALMGVVGVWGVVGSIGVGVLSIMLALRFWKFALTKYTSASS